MKRNCIVLLVAALLGVSASYGKTAQNVTNVESAVSVERTDATPKAKKAIAKKTTKKTVEARKYEPSAMGDCYIGQRIRVPNTTGMWCEITFYPEGNCELKMEKSSLKGTYTGTIKGSKYKIEVKFNNGEEYDFIGTQSKLVADDGLVKYVVEIER